MRIILILGTLLILSLGCVGEGEKEVTETMAPPTITQAPAPTAITLSLLEQKQIFYEIVAEQDKCYEKYEITLDPEDLPESECSEEATARVIKKYSITVEEEKEISRKALTEHWPMPEYLPTTIPSTNVEQLSGAIQVVASNLETNQLGIAPEDLVSLENPKGEGIFVYVGQTEFAGVERYIIWLVLNDIAYPLNGATKDVTPSLPWPRDAQADEWEKTGLSSFSATVAIEIVFNVQ